MLHLVLFCYVLDLVWFGSFAKLYFYFKTAFKNFDFNELTVCLVWVVYVFMCMCMCLPVGVRGSLGEPWENNCVYLYSVLWKAVQQIDGQTDKLTDCWEDIQKDRH